LYQKKVGLLTEYFEFHDVKPVLRDLHRMKAKELSELERDILAGLPAEMEQMIAREGRQQRQRQAIREGMKQAAERGQHVGRPSGREDRNRFLSKSKSQAIQEALASGLSLRQTARQVGVSVNTVRKVQALLKD